MYKFSILLISSFLISCASASYFTDRLPNSVIPDFSTYKVESYCDEEISPIHAIRLENAIHTVLLEKGLQRSENPDIYIHAKLKHSDKTYIQPCGPYDRLLGGELCQLRYLEYEEGTMVIDLIDASTNKIFWHGAAVGHSFKDISNADKRILKLVTNLFDRYFKEHRFNSDYAHSN